MDRLDCNVGLPLSPSVVHAECNRANHRVLPVAVACVFTLSGGADVLVPFGLFRFLLLGSPRFVLL